MTNVYQLFHPTQPQSGKPKYAFTPQEVLLCLSSTLGRQILMPMAEQAMVSFGLTDENHGWLACSNIQRRQVGWVDTTPVYLIEKNEEGFQAHFSLARRGVLNDFQQKSLTSIFERRQRQSIFNLSYVIFMHHLPVADRFFEKLNNDLDEYDRPVIWWQRTGGDDLDWDYKFLSEMQSHVYEATVSVSQDLRRGETERVFNGR